MSPKLRLLGGKSKARGLQQLRGCGCGILPPVAGQGIDKAVHTLLFGVTLPGREYVPNSALLQTGPKLGLEHYWFDLPASGEHARGGPGSPFRSYGPEDLRPHSAAHHRIRHLAVE